MQKYSLKFWLLNGGIIFYLLASEPAAAQIVPDATLPNNSVVLPDCANCEITGGTTVGNNLFHSFQQFSIPTGGTAYFNNASAIENIITRVTGKSFSNIDGLIRANGTANLFLLNPNGIIFGSNASLNIGGSFLASTASSLKFGDGTEFSAINPQSQPLLTISVPIGLQFGDSAGRIVNQSQASLGVNLFGLPAGLQVQPGRTLALVGGDLVLERGNITAETGRIELGSVAGNNLVSLTLNERGWVLGYEGIQNFQDINLSQTSFVDTSGDRGGDIQIQGRRIILTEGSQVFSNSLTAGQAGNLRVNASESVELLGVGTFPDGGFFPTGLFARVEKEATGEGATLTIETRRLSIRDGGTVSTATFGAGRGVDLVVKASELVEIEGTSPDAGFPSSLFAGVDVDNPGEEARGQGGTLTIETRRLSVRDGAQVATTTFSSGDAGDLKVNASESVELDGFSPGDIFSSGLFTQVNTQLFEVNGNLIEQEAKGNAGNLTIETGRLIVLNGAQISSYTGSVGKGGTLTINASDFIQLSGASPTATSTVGRSGLFVSAEQGATGNAGELKITTGQLTVENGAEISANNFGPGEQGKATLNVGQLIIRNGGEVRAKSFSSGKAGNLIVNADEFIVLDNSGILSADTKGGGGDITVNSPSLILRRNSSITTNATGSEVKGGDITLNTDVLVALENSDISANSEEFQGGNVTITAQAIFGTQPRDALTSESDITATGRTQAGTIIINTPDVDPSSGLIQLPENFVDASSLVDRRCSPSNRASRFVVTGSGGLPASPIAVLSGDAIDVNWVTLPQERGRGAEERRSRGAEEDNFIVGSRIIEAQGWVTGPNGEVILTANPPTATPHNSWQRPIDCP